MILTFNKEDAQPAGLLSGYLHDAPCVWSRNAFDEVQGKLVITAYRPRHEAPLQKALLGFIPQVAFQGVPATLTVFGVLSARLDPEGLKPGQRAIFDYVEVKGSTLSIGFQGGAIEAELDTWTGIELRDVGPPTEKPQVYFPFAWTAFDGMAAELRQRSSDA